MTTIYEITNLDGNNPHLHLYKLGKRETYGWFLLYTCNGQHSAAKLHGGHLELHRSLIMLLSQITHKNRKHQKMTHTDTNKLRRI